jgi:hypothetical protein
MGIHAFRLFQKLCKLGFARFDSDTAWLDDLLDEFLFALSE